MNFEIAKKIVDHMKSCDTHINSIFEIIEEIEDEEERKMMRRRCAEVMGSMYSEILRPIELEYPSLEI